MVGVGLTGTSGVRAKEVSKGPVLGRLSIKSLIDHLKIGFSIKEWAEVILQEAKG